MEKKAIEQFIDTGIKLKEEYRQNTRDLATDGIADLSGDMPSGMHEWMSNIRIYVKRHLTNHPLYEDINSVLFHNKNRIKDYDKMMGLLKALSQDIASLENSGGAEDTRPPLHDTIAIRTIPNRLPQNSRYLLKEIVESENPTKMICERFEKCSIQEDKVLRSLLREFKDQGYIKILWANNVPYNIQINNSARTYFEQEEEYTLMFEAGNSGRKLKDYDVFISHANTDKSDYVNELFLSIKRLGINIFYDSDILSWGDNWKDTILRGTEQSEFAIIVISESFFGREWTERELSEFLQRQNKMKQKIVLPLIHNITFEQLQLKYPSLRYIQSIRSDECSVEQIAILLAKELIKRYKG